MANQLEILTDDILRADLAALVEAMNASTDPAERIELHAQIVHVRRILAGGGR